MYQKFIYVASPYSSGADEDLMTHRARDTAYKMSQLINRFTDYFFYSPVCHFRSIAIEGHLPHDRHFWWGVNEYMLNRSDEMWILDIPGWEESDGVKQEIEYAKKLGIPIRVVKINSTPQLCIVGNMCSDYFHFRTI